jgi:two-component system chemotaxis sensor kinase CheA
MSDTRQDQLEDTSILRETLDSLASQLILGDGSCPDAWLKEIGGTLARIGAMAELSNHTDIRRVSLALEQQAARVRRGEGDRSTFEPALSAGLAQLREALDRANAAPSQAVEVPAAPAPANLLAQDRELVSEFILEAREHLAGIEAQLLALEQNPGDPDPIHSIFRGFHTIKGVAGFLEFSAIQAVAHEVETLLDLARNGRLAVTPAVIDAVLAGADYLGGDIGRVESEMNGAAVTPSGNNHALLETIRALMGEPAIDSLEPKPNPAGADLRNLTQAVVGVENPALETEAQPATQGGTSGKKPVGGAVK